MKTHGDDGWQSHPSYLDIAVPRILEFLARRKLAISFFFIGQDAALAKNRDALRAIAAAGHEIGNHSFRHEPWLHRYSKAELDREFREAEDAIESATGVRTRGFRGPGFSVTASTRAARRPAGTNYAVCRPSFTPKQRTRAARHCPNLAFKGTATGGRISRAGRSCGNRDKTRVCRHSVCPTAQGAGERGTARSRDCGFSAPACDTTAGLARCRQSGSATAVRAARGTLSAIHAGWSQNGRGDARPARLTPQGFAWAPPICSCASCARAHPRRAAPRASRGDCPPTRD